MRKANTYEDYIWEKPTHEDYIWEKQTHMRIIKLN